VVGSSEHTHEPLGSTKVDNFLTSQVTVSFSSRTLLHGVGWLVGLNDVYIIVSTMLGIHISCVISYK